MVDLFWVVAGPGATRMLADYGATVVHVESTRKVDMLRNVPPYIDGAMDPERAAAHHSTNANKLNITLDITTAEGQGGARRPDPLGGRAHGVLRPRRHRPHGLWL